jgi:GGDEF domain-containing protein
MTAPRNRHPGAGYLLDMRDEEDFLSCLGEAIQSCQAGRPNALMHLDVARADDISAHCGASGAHALRDLVDAMVHNQLGPTVPVHETGTCAMSLLLPNTLPQGAVTLARRLRGAIDNGTFTWHGHPFRLGAHIGLVELSHQPPDPAMWMRLVQAACKAARELGGSGIQMVTGSEQAWRDLEKEKEWHDHLSEVI